MQAHLRQATTAQLDAIEPMVAAYHDFESIHSTTASRRSALRKLLQDTRLGALWLIEVGDAMAGYIVLCRGFSIEFNGFDAFVDEFYLHPEFRGQGIGREVLGAIREKARALDINAIHLEVARDNSPARRLYASAGFVARDRYLLMTAVLENE